MFDCELAELIAVFTCRPAWPVGCPVRGGLTMGLTSAPRTSEQSSVWTRRDSPDVNWTYVFGKRSDLTKERTRKRITRLDVERRHQCRAHKAKDAGRTDDARMHGSGSHVTHLSRVAHAVSGALQGPCSVK